MKLLQDLCYQCIGDYFHKVEFGAKLARLPGKVKTVLLERLLLHEKLDLHNWSVLINYAYLHNLQSIRLPQCSALSDHFLYSIDASGCFLKELLLVVPVNDKPGSKQCAVSASGLSALISGQSELQKFTLVWCVGFQSGVLCKLRSSRLATVTLHGDGLCRCFAQRHPVLRLSKVSDNPYQREVGLLALNNPTITNLSLDGILLDLEDCTTLLTALSHCLERLDVKVVRHYQFCRKEHCFFGTNFVPFLQLVDDTCKKLRFLSCYSHELDNQTDKPLVMSKCLTLHTLCLENHFFISPLIVPPSVEKLKISLCGSEMLTSLSYLSALPKLQKVHLNFPTNQQLTPVFADKLFSLLGPKLVSVTGLDAAMAPNWLVNAWLANCHNLKTLQWRNSAMAEFNGRRRERRERVQIDTVAITRLLGPFFADAKRVRKLKHLHLGLGPISRDILFDLARFGSGLKSLDLAYCSTLDDVILEAIVAKCCKYLKVLDISRCNNVSDVGIISVAQNCANLEEISMFDVSVTDAGLIALANGCVGLKVCGLNANSVSKYALDYLRRSCVNRLVV